MNPRQLALAALAVLALGGPALAQTAPGPVPPAPPSPPPPQTGAPGNQATPVPLLGTPAPAASASPSPSPGASASPAARRGRRGAPAPEPSASETPPPPQFQNLDGVWEVQLQPLDSTGRTVYSHLYVAQTGDQIKGQWVRSNNEKIPFTGTFDGRLFQISAKDAKANEYTMTGYIENFSDAVGLLKSGAKDTGTPFTASHRKKERLQPT